MDYAALPLLLLLGFGLLAFASDDDEESGGTLGDADEGGILPEEQPITYIRFDENDDIESFGIGPEAIFAEGGNDQISAGAGNDQIFLSDGDDLSFIDADGDNLPDDPITGALGADFIRGGDGADVLIDGEGSNELFGDLKADVLDATENSPEATNAADLLFGGFGADTLIGDDGDEMYGGEGVDSFIVEFDAATDDAVVISDYVAGETILIQVPETSENEDATATVSDDGINISIGDVTVLIVQGITDPEELNLTVEAIL